MRSHFQPKLEIVSKESLIKIELKFRVVYVDEKTVKLVCKEVFL